MESNAGKQYHGEEESKPGNGFLVSENTEDVDASGVDDESTGMTDDDFLGTSNKENRDDD